MALVSTNPATEEVVKSFDEASEEEVKLMISKAQQAYEEWRYLSFEKRAEPMRRLADLLKNNSGKLGKIMTLEMGKPIKQAKAEAEKCAWVCEYYAEMARGFLARDYVDTGTRESYIQYDPLGIVLAVMPWNFPFWQVIRAAAPALMAGNVMLLKHASNVPQCGFKIEEICREAGFPEGVFTFLPIGSSKVGAVIKDPRVKAATLTGSGKAGSIVASECGSEIKKTVLELGGSDPFIVLEDAEIQLACEVAVSARFQNGGQSCIAAKRFIVVESGHDEFLEKFKQYAVAKKLGDPMQEDTDMGPLASKQILDDVVQQVDKSVEMGAEVVCGGKRLEEKGYFYEYTILAGVKKGMPVYDQETFGPVAAVIKVANEEEAIKVANDTEFGLGASIWTKDVEKAKKLVAQIDAGAVFVNGMVKSDPRLPFGGVKKSGYGRELSGQGIREFVNEKTVWIK